ncbi:MAG: PDZ domain-containing protein [Ignavibacteria bacterium]|nr:PDZ domain-containing protein [Ignavibacteria bacterium]
MRFKGRFVQSLEESSFDTWVKYYRKDENSNNSQISYYTKGALVSMILNLEIIKNTNAAKSLDDALRMLYADFEKDNSKGFTDGRIREVCETVSGKKLNDFWEKYITGVDDLPLDKYLGFCGLELINENAPENILPDIEVKSENGKLIVAKVFAGGSAYESGLNSGDELIAVNGIRISETILKTVLKNYSPGDQIKMLISRKGIISEINVKLLKPIPKYKIKESEAKSDEQKKILEKWISG